MQQKSSYILSLFNKIYSLGDLNPDISYGSGNHISCFTENRPFIPDPSKINWIEWKNTRIPFFLMPDILKSFPGRKIILICEGIILALAIDLGQHQIVTNQNNQFLQGLRLTKVMGDWKLITCLTP
jgi:hypothetical protein